MIIPIIMAGGNGSRLWPLSRTLYPKQFLSFDNRHSMLQETLLRLDGLQCSPPLIICNEEHRFIVAEQLRGLNLLSNNIILEPVGRNTAPAIALAAFSIHKNKPDEDPCMLVLAADHSIKNDMLFRKVVEDATKYALLGRLVTFGIVPTTAETGYGYIHRGQSMIDCNNDFAFKVDKFVEKPTLEVAQRYIESGEYYWNSGMFLFRVSRYLEELKKYRPDIYEACDKATSCIDYDLDFIRVNESEFRSCPDESIDYAVMEHTEDAVVIPMDVGWNDVGSWSSLWSISDKNADGNSCYGDVISHSTKNSYIYSESCLVTTLGVEDLIIVQTKDALLVANKNSVQDVKKIVEKIKNEGRQEHFVHREVYRPWGKYDSIDEGSRYQVKRITINPGEGISLQMHYHRSEHWIIVAGTAKVTLDGEVRLLTENESIYIPSGSPHCLQNPGKIPLNLIEVRSGSYLEEDDIIRIRDENGTV
ncbi:mannose-1-phosphate guanylyltransferase/mannose-6-phosphate isomerase [Escherichia coli]|mgnify:FL=1|uniref:mannose-1-phosphate guanylyltransferase n=2 Tax=Escherichia coli TaxID=562 RepID=A0A0A7DN91_ECOLX|nr:MULTISPECIES: mannose-1-phosphate guanylyltransferase/mannose-6-phosphate isomerase [Enterobacteriaceae]HCH8951140.1 mannose-1-phosphate guanylyltransferase/mannose-6-phosphate isomerase [Shigella flexneri]AIT92166.1 mannose-1-phosphate guanyltransferase [Escherichia coli]EAB6805817.1 mannose-1-phosphate guanylyltransferase/mannose-6-phosphate isomerase [Escherichia coli]EEW2201818.1 mannose-1-phosphate guanylyltransferase/mannose-6-phosphate isomerase [Escherichia coli]EEX0338132.1 mannose